MILMVLWHVFGGNYFELKQKQHGKSFICTHVYHMSIHMYNTFKTKLIKNEKGHIKGAGGMDGEEGTCPLPILSSKEPALRLHISCI